MRVREVTARRTGLDHRDVGLLRHHLQRVPGAIVEAPGRRHDHRPLGLADHLDRLREIGGPGVRLGIGAIARLVVEVLELARVLEPRARHLAGEVEVHRTRHTGAQVAKRVGGVLPHPLGIDQPLAPLLQAFGGGLLIAALDVRLGVVARHRHVRRQHQQRRARRVRRADVHDHVGEAGALGARARGDLAGDADEAVGGGAHAALGATAVGGDALGRDRVDDRVVARRAEQRGQAFLAAGAREHLGAVHRELGGLRRLGARRGEVVRDADGVAGGVGGGGDRALRGAERGHDRSALRRVLEKAAPRHACAPDAAPCALLPLVDGTSRSPSVRRDVTEPRFPSPPPRPPCGRADSGPMLRRNHTSSHTC